MTNLTTDFISCMLIPLRKHYLLLPKASIAEVIPMPDITKETQSPIYYIGQYLWETGPLTILNLEYLVNKKEPLGKAATKLCIIYGAHNDKLKAYALACYGPPQLLHLNETALKLVDDGIAESMFLHCRVYIANKVAYIPSLEKLEGIVLQQL